MSQSRLVPTPGCWVKRSRDDRAGWVRECARDRDGYRLYVCWLPSGPTEWVPLDEMGCGFKLGMDVQDVPRSRTRRSLGEGVVVDLRKLGGREQVLVEFPAIGTLVWLPYEHVRHIRGVRSRFLNPRAAPAGEAERFRLRNLAHALELWNENTGALSHLDIDPLPHQIHLAHHILASGNLNWLIADDVGLGKTIETGMLLAALKRRGLARRVLLITPAGLTRQWQDELHYKFGMDEFVIYGKEFEVSHARQWKLYDHVIGSVDTLKQQQRLDLLLQADPWDIVVFDEAHRLSRRQWGSKYEAADRFKLAAALREKTDAVLLLSGTPHQGMQDKFQALLELLRPELKREIDRLTLNPEILRDMVIRNHKADVTDADGNFVFKGKTTRTIPVEIGTEATEFDRALQAYLRRGYAAGRALGRQGIAIGFVMTVYRKLAASSAAAIHRALVRRLARLRSEIADSPLAEAPSDERFAGEWEEMQTGGEREFFEGEVDLLEDLIARAASLVATDAKRAAFIENLVDSVLHANTREKVLVFTEYRATQEHVARTLRARFGEDAVALIHGGQKFPERASEIARFEDAAQFLVSTEAGGEGINLHRRCHVMVNYDLPWNPMRLVQRIGRLYRYGQEKRVVVFNMHAPQTLDGDIMQMMYTRLTQVVQDMAVLGHEFNEGLADDILGELADLLEVEQVLEQAMEAGIERTAARIDEALRRARDAAAKQRELFAYAAGYDPEEARGEMAITRDHLRAFVEGMFARTGIEIVARAYAGAVWDLRLPDELAGAVPGSRTRLRVTLERGVAATRPDVHMLDLDSPLLRHLLDLAKAWDGGGQAAALVGLSGTAVLTAVLRWQNDQGRRMRQEFTVIRLRDGMPPDTNPSGFVPWLLAPARDGPVPRGDVDRRTQLAAAEAAVDARLAAVSTRDLHPENRQWVSAGWLGGGADP